MPPRVPGTVSQTSHALVIRFNGEVIGAVYGWNPDETRAVSEHYEFGGIETGTTPFGKWPGQPFEKVPGNISGQRIEVQRVDIYRRRFEQILRGQPMEETLAQQLAWFSATEVWGAPDSATIALANGVGLPSPGAASYDRVYHGCWFARLGRTLSTTDDRVVKASSTIEYTAKQFVPVST